MQLSTDEEQSYVSTAKVDEVGTAIGRLEAVQRAPNPDEESTAPNPEA